MKRLVALIMVLVAINTVMVAPAMADEGVTIESTASDIPQELVREIIEANPGYNITIYEWGTNEEREENVDKNSIVIGMVGFKVVSKTTTRSNVTVSDKFIISVAKGQTIKLSKKKTFSHKGSISGKAKAKDLGLELTMTKEYSTEGSWSGPPEESQYNSGEYRIKFFEDQGTLYWIPDF